MTILRILLSLTMIGLLFGAESVWAVAKTWRSAAGANATNWNRAQNWAPAGVPAAGDDVTIPTVPNNGTGFPVLNTSPTILTLAIQAGASVTGAAGQSLTVTGAITGAGTLTGGASPITVGGNMTVNALTSTSTVTYNGAGAQTIGGAVHSYTNLTVNKVSGTAAFASNALVAGDLIVSAGILDLGAFTANRTVAGGTISVAAGATLRIGGTNTFPANYATHTLNATSTVDYSGAAQTVSAETYGHLSLSGSGTKTMTGVGTVNGNFTLSGTAAATTAANLTVGGNLDVGAGPALTSGAFDFIVTGTTSVSGTLAHSSATGTKRHIGLATINAGGVWNNSGNAPVNFRGGLTHNGATFTAGSGTYSFDTNNQAIGGSAALSIPSVTVTAVTLTNNSTLGLTVSTDLAGTGGLTNGANAILRLGGLSGITALTATANPNLVVYNGTAAQTIKATTYHDLEADNSAGTSITANTTVNNVLTLRAGNLSTGVNTLITAANCGTPSVSRPGGTPGHVVGNLQKAIPSGNSSCTFEVGSVSAYAPVDTSYTGVTTAGNVLGSTATPDHASIATAGIDSTKSVNRYWTLNTPVTGALPIGGTYSATFNFVAGDVDGGASTAAFIVKRFLGGSWFTTTTGTRTATSTQATGLSAYGEFAVGEVAPTVFSRERQFIYTRELY